MPSGSLGSRSLQLGGLPAFEAELLRLGQREGWCASGTFGVDCTTFDLAGLAGDTRGPFQVLFEGKMALSSAGNFLGVRINGSSASIHRVGMFGEVGAGADTVVITAGEMELMAEVSELGGGWRMLMTCLGPQAARGGPPVVHVLWESTRLLGAGTSDVANAHVVCRGPGPWAAIDSVGLHATAVNSLSAASTYTVRRL